jgi:hypothetical protein
MNHTHNLLDQIQKASKNEIKCETWLHAMKKKLSEKEIDDIYNKCRNATSHKIQGVGVTVV